MAVTSSSGGLGSNSTNPTISLGFTANAGDLVVVIAAQDGAGSISWPGGGTPWTQLWSNTFTGATWSGGRRICTGGETSVAPTSTVSERWEWIIFRIPSGEWHGTTAPEVPAQATGSSTTPNPPSVTPSWGEGSTNIYIACTGRDDSVVNTITAYPTNYGTAQIDKNDITSAANVGGAARTSGGSSPEDPGTFTISASETWAAQTIAIRGPSTSPINLTLSPVATTTAVPADSLQQNLGPSPTPAITAVPSPTFQLNLSPIPTPAVTAVPVLTMAFDGIQLPLSPVAAITDVPVLDITVGSPTFPSDTSWWIVIRHPPVMEDVRLRSDL